MERLQREAQLHPLLQVDAAFPIHINTIYPSLVSQALTLRISAFIHCVSLSGPPLVTMPPPPPPELKGLLNALLFTITSFQGVIRSLSLYLFPYSCWPRRLRIPAGRGSEAFFQKRACLRFGTYNVSVKREVVGW